MNWETRLATMVRSAAEAAVATASAQTNAGQRVELRLFYREATPEEDGALCACPADAVPEGFKQGSADLLHGGVPYDHYGVWIRHRIGNLPLLSAKR